MSVGRILPRSGSGADNGTMSCAVILTFDMKTDARIRAAWSALADAGVTRSMLGPGFRPHLTLYVAEELDFGPLEVELTTLAEDLQPLAIGLPGIGLFPDTGTVCLDGWTEVREIAFGPEGQSE